MQTLLQHWSARSGRFTHGPLASLLSPLLVLLLLLATGPAATGANSPAVAATPVAQAVLPWPGSVPLPPGGSATAGRLPAPMPSDVRVPAAELLRIVGARPAPSQGVWPMRPRPAVVAGFDPPASRWAAGHRGVDLAGAPLAAVYSSLPGTVTFAGRIAGRGVVVVSHGRTRTTYEPVAASVGVGDRVPSGAMIGRLQLFGSHCFPRWCLHWGLIEGRDHYLDPLTLVGAAPVRLLPVEGAGALGPLLGGG